MTEALCWGDRPPLAEAKDNLPPVFTVLCPPSSPLATSTEVNTVPARRVTKLQLPSVPTSSKPDIGGEEVSKNADPLGVWYVKDRFEKRTSR